METKTELSVADKARLESEARLFGGDPSAPFDDGVTPEVMARIKLRQELFEKEKEARKRQKLSRKSERILNSPLKRAALELSHARFVTALTPEEHKRAVQLAQGKLLKGQRRDVQVVLYTWLRVCFSARGGPHILCTRHLSDAPAAIRLADMMRVVMWPYRRDGKQGIKVEDGSYNLSYARAVADLKNENVIGALVENFRAELLKLVDADGIPLLSDDPAPPANTNTMRKRERQQHVATLMRRMDELAGQRTSDRKALVEMLGVCTRLMARVTELEAANNSQKSGCFES
jgi:hypothetical protein